MLLQTIKRWPFPIKMMAVVRSLMPEAALWVLLLSPVLFTGGSAQALPRPAFPLLPLPGVPHSLQSYAPEGAPGASLAPAAFAFEVRRSAWLVGPGVAAVLFKKRQKIL